MKKISVLGAGLVGAPMAFDLENEFSVTAFDADEKALKKFSKSNISVQKANLANKETLEAAVRDSHYTINALPGFMGYKVLKQLIEMGETVVDISFFPEDPEGLVTAAKQSGSTAVIDCGVAPGMSNMLAGFLNSYFDKLTKLRIYVGGLPKHRQQPWEYKAVFSPSDVLEEYTRKARFVKDGQVVYKEALTDIELLEFPVTGILEAFNTDGLRSLIKNINCPDMIEKTLRYPGYAGKIKLLKQSGFLSADPILIKGMKISPLEFTAGILFPAWELKAGNKDLTVMLIQAEGFKNGQKQRISYNLLDNYDETTGVHSMARTTGYTATATLRMIDAGLTDLNGLVYPEFIGAREKCLNYIFNDLKKKNIVYKKTVKILES